MNYAWVIDQTKCIGCHACSTACKSENDVPLGVYRTWVKNVEVGEFPNVRRHFAVLRCNHCADPPCVHICPVRAMFQRSDGIVDIDHSRCIGCKACMQACPYDAIHIDPERDTAAKCHFCAHRIDRGLLPACVVVCPVEALVFGDLDDPGSRVSHVVGSTPVSVRRPEQGTRPKAYYVGGHEATLDPLAATHGASYMWADRVSGTAKDNAGAVSGWLPIRPRSSEADVGSRLGRLVSGSTPPRTPQSRMPTARVAYDVQHVITWRGKVSLYLWTKSIAAGAVFVTVVARLLGISRDDAFHAVAAPGIGLIALAITGALLIADLKRPERFWFIMLKPQWRSWLTRGAYLITLYGGLLVTLLLLVIAGKDPPGQLWWLSGMSAAGVAVYTAFLFGQCEARDLWQTPLLGIELGIQMVMAGAATMLLASLAIPTAASTIRFLEFALATSLVAHVVSVLLGEAAARHGSANAVAAARLLTRGRYAGLFWGALLLGSVAPIILLIASPVDLVTPVAATMVLGGLLAYEHAFVMAGQAVPIS